MTYDEFEAELMLETQFRGLLIANKRLRARITQLIKYFTLCNIQRAATA